MAVISLDTNYIVDQLSQAVYGLRIEIAIFVLAFCAHALLFGKHSILSRKADMAAKAKAACGGQISNAAQSDAPVLAAEDIIRGSAGKPEVATNNLRMRVAGFASHEVAQALVRLLQSAGRMPQVELLAAVSAVGKERSLALNSTLGETLLKGLYTQQSMSEFDSVLSDIEMEAKGASLVVGVGVQALKGELRRGDIEAH